MNPRALFLVGKTGWIRDKWTEDDATFFLGLKTLCLTAYHEWGRPFHVQEASYKDRGSGE